MTPRGTFILNVICFYDRIVKGVESNDLTQSYRRGSINKAISISERKTFQSCKCKEMCILRVYFCMTQSELIILFLKLLLCYYY